MIDWLDWLDAMAPGWDFSYPENADYGQFSKEQFVGVLRDWGTGQFADSTTNANMKICLTENQMMAHKLAWDVKRIEKEPFLNRML